MEVVLCMALDNTLLTSSEVELMETTRQDFATLFFNKILLTSSEVELMET